MNLNGELIPTSGGLSLVPAASTLVIGFVVAMGGALLGVSVVGSIFGRDAGLEMIQASGVVASVPLGTAVVWAYRAVLSQRDYRRWLKLGRPGDHLPPWRSQPRDADLLMAAPWVLLLAAFFLML